MPTKSAQTKEQIMRMFIGIGVGVVLLFVALFFTTWIISDPIIAIILAIMVAAVPYLTWVIPELTFYVPGDEAWIMVNPWITERVRKLLVFSGYREIIAQKEFHSGNHWRYFREVLVKKVDLNRKVLVAPEPGEVTTTADGVTYRIDWIVQFAPLPGSLVNNTKTDEEEARKQVTARVKKFNNAYFGDLRSQNVGFGSTQFANYTEQFEKQFGGPNEVDLSLEEPLGIWTKPQVLGIRQSSLVEEAAQLKNAIEKYSTVAKELVEASGGSLDFKTALGLVTMLQNNMHGNQQVSLVDATELLLGKSLGKGK